jgi:hypothetical protein
VDFDGHCHCLLDSHKYEATNIDNDNTCSDDDYSKKRHNHTLNEYQAMTSFPLLLRHMSVFIFVLIHFLSLVHIPLLHIIKGRL